MKPSRPMHPVMIQRAQLIKEAHAHLAVSVPEYKNAPPRQKMMMAQDHARMRIANMGKK